MGQLMYGGSPAIVIDDWPLRHLEAVILGKLRRDESFPMHWDHEAGISGTTAANLAPGQWGTVWISKSSLLYFSYDAAPTGPLNRMWLTVLSESANSNGGLHLVVEPGFVDASAGNG